MTLKRKVIWMSSNCYGVKLAKHALSYVGVKRGSKKHSDIVKRFNALNIKGEHATTNDAWCSIFASVMMHDVGFTSKEAPFDWNCGTMISKAKNLSTWVESDSYKPEVGDLVIYDWNDNGKGENKDGASHIGIVYKVTSSYFYVVEGNKGTTSEVGTRKVAINGQFIRGFIHLKHRAKRINEIATDYSYGLGFPEKRYMVEKGGKPRATYRQAWKKYFPDKRIDPPACHKFAMLVLRACGYAKMPLTWSGILAYLKKRFDTVQFDHKSSQLRKGDIMVYKRVDSKGKSHYHIWFVVEVDGKLCMAEARQSIAYPCKRSINKALKPYSKTWVFRAR